MKPVIAKRETICNICKEIIEKGSTRLDDVIRGKGRDRVIYIRRHYHTNCYQTYVEEWGDIHRNDSYAGSGGRIGNVDLSEDDKIQRQKLLRNLASCWRYYILEGKLNIQDPVESLSWDDVRMFENFSFRYRSITSQLSVLGGTPPRYVGVDIESVQSRSQAVENLLHNTSQDNIDSE